MTKLVKHSIRFRLIAIMIVLMGLSFVTLWAVNEQFLEKFYYENKVNQMIDSCEVIQYCANTESLTEDEISNRIQQIRDKYNLALLYIDKEWNDWKEFASPWESELLRKRLMELLFADMSQLSFLYNSSGMWICEIKELQSQTSYLYAWGIASDSSMFIMRTPLESISDSTQIANRFLLYTGSIIVVFAALVMFLATRSMTNPILQLAVLSERMAQLDFQERYTGKQEDEIGILGKSMNTMADTLEKSIQELKETNAQLKQEIDEKVQIDEMRKEFLSNVSHELKTPIALIQGYAEGLQEVVNEDPESRDYYCEVIMDEASKMNVMVRKLLTLNHLEFGQDVLEIEEFNLSDLIYAVVQASSLLISQKEAKVVLDIPKLCIVRGDEFKIEEVLTNYVSNALNHLDGTKQIKIWIEELVQEGIDGEKQSNQSNQMKKVRVNVFNTGEWIPEADLDKVWIKFYKVDKARTRAYGGSGIGLSIVKAIMDSHHQAFGVKNVEDGVCFWFELEKV